MAKWWCLISITKLVLFLNFITIALGNNNLSSGFSAFYFIQQWLPSYCNQKGTTCCYPPTGKPPASFSIYGLWPYKDDGSSLQHCDGESFDVARLKPIENMLQKNWPSFTWPQIGRKFWLHEWNKHGTCSKSSLDEIPYFQATLNLQNKINILQTLKKANIHPNNKSYPLEKIIATISRATGFRPFIYCNHDAQGNSQIWQVAHCVHQSGANLINCNNNSLQGQQGCTSSVKFPSY